MPILDVYKRQMVCFSYRFKAAARYAKELVEKGMLGDIYHVYMQYLQGGGGPSYDLPRSWRYQKKLTGTGALGDLGCHALDLVSFVTGKNYRKAVGHTDTYVTQRRLEEGEGYGPVDVDDFCHYLMEMDGKTSANFSVTRFAYGRGNYQRMEIYGSKGGLVYSLSLIHILYKIGMISNQYSLSAAVNLFNTVINFVLLLLVNGFSKKLGDTSLW